MNKNSAADAYLEIFIKIGIVRLDDFYPRVSFVYVVISYPCARSVNCFDRCASMLETMIS